MRRIRYSVAMSFDGLIAGPQGEYDWIPNEPEIDWGAFMARFDTMLLGRRRTSHLDAPGGKPYPIWPPTSSRGRRGQRTTLV
jgi:hypothetical protein